MQKILCKQYSVIGNKQYSEFFSIQDSLKNFFNQCFFIFVAG